MASLVIKELPVVLHRRLKERAERHHRSMTKEAIALLEQALEQSPTGRELTLPYQGKLPLTQEFVDQAKREARK